MSNPQPATIAPRSATIVAVAIVVLAGTLLYRNNVPEEIPPDFSRGGAFAGDLVNPGLDGDLSISTPAPRPAAAARSHATVRAPKGAAVAKNFVDRPPFPSLGTYVYAVTGTESASLFTSRDYPPEMEMTVHRPESSIQRPGQQSGAPLASDELVFDLFFSQDHEEREIVAYGKHGIAFTFEGGSITIGTDAQTTEATYDPPMVQIPVPLAQEATVEGTSRAIAPDGSTVRTEDWSVTVTGVDQLQVMDETVETFVVKIERQSQPGSDEQLTRSRTYWVDPARSIWVKFEEHSSSSRGSGLSASSYSSDFTATLDRIEPL